MANHFVNREAAALAREQVSFSFGSNWHKFLESLRVESIEHAKTSLTASFAGASLTGEVFLDIGCGSGLFSLCAYQLGAAAVVSVDVDPQAVACVNALRSHVGNPENWTVDRGSILDQHYVRTLPRATRAYSWGVLHHTGAMWDALSTVLSLVLPGGLCCLGLYNPPHLPALQVAVKRLYNLLPRHVKPVMRGSYGLAKLAALLLVRRRSPIRYVRQYGERARGMSYWRDVEDWLGGLPYEYTSEADIRGFTERRGYTLEQVITRSAGACNEYLLRRTG